MHPYDSVTSTSSLVLKYRTFPYVISSVWNSLPSFLCLIRSIFYFKASNASVKQEAGKSIKPDYTEILNHAMAFSTFVYA